MVDRAQDRPVGQPTIGGRAGGDGTERLHGQPQHASLVRVEPGGVQPALATGGTFGEEFVAIGSIGRPDEQTERRGRRVERAHGRNRRSATVIVPDSTRNRISASRPSPPSSPWNPSVISR